MAGKSTFIAVPLDVANNPQSLARFLYTLVEKLDVAFGNRGNGGFATPQQALSFARTQAGQAENEAIAASSAASQAALNLAKVYTDDEVAAAKVYTDDEVAAAKVYTDSSVSALLEAGAWTPEVSFGGGSAGITYTTQEGSYYVVGKLLLASCAIELSAIGTDTGVMAVEGLPYAAKNTTSVEFIAQCLMDNAASALEQPLARLTAGSTVVDIISGSGADAAAQLLDTDATATTKISFSISYEID